MRKESRPGGPQGGRPPALPTPALSGSGSWVCCAPAQHSQPLCRHVPTPVGSPVIGANLGRTSSPVKVLAVLANGYDASSLPNQYWIRAPFTSIRLRRNKMRRESRLTASQPFLAMVLAATARQYCSASASFGIVTPILLR